MFPWPLLSLSLLILHSKTNRGSKKSKETHTKREEEKEGRRKNRKMLYFEVQLLM
jgi:hypothetical protein